MTKSFPTIAAAVGLAIAAFNPANAYTITPGEDAFAHCTVIAFKAAQVPGKHLSQADGVRITGRACGRELQALKSEVGFVEATRRAARIIVIALRYH